MTDILISQVIPVLVTAAGSILTTLLMIGMKRANEWIRTKVESQRMETALIQLSEAVGGVVMDLEAEVRRFMTDGKLTQDEQRSLKALARGRIEAQAPAALSALALAGIRDMEGFINGKIEEAVSNLPRSNQPEAE